MRFYLPFPVAIPLVKPGYLYLTHPFATHSLRNAFDLHVLGTPPAFILSQDQTLHCFLFNTISCFLSSFFFSLFLEVFSLLLLY